MPRGTTPRAADLSVATPRRPLTRPPAITGGSRLHLLRMRTLRTRFGQGLGEDVHRGLGAGSHRPGSLVPHHPGYSFPSMPVSGMLHGVARTVVVRVIPRSRRIGVQEAEDGTLTIRVRAAPEAGRATEEAARALAEHLDIPRTSVRLRAGATSRLKRFEVPESAL
jgi:uncharacterized protein YggU (UPF0235/DUF167 family)